MRRVDLLGRRFGRWTVIADGEAQYSWLCRCDCGNEKTVSAAHLTRGASSSCGCLRAERLSRISRRHGHAAAKSPEWRSWHCMRSRCEQPGDASFQNYGARGIKVCSRWRTFESFLADMGPKPTPAHTIERLDSTRDYEPGNCRWATPKEQARNRNTNVWIEHGGERLILADWARRLGMTRTALGNRLRKLGSELAVTLPKGYRL